MLGRTPLAAYSFTSSKGANIHVCYQDESGQIAQTFYDDQSGWCPGTHGIVGTADLNNGIAITGWDGGNEERVYYIGKDNKIVERCHSPGQDWYDGELTGLFTAAHYSDLTVVSFDARGTWCIRVYYQDEKNIIREACRDGTGSWFDGHTFPAGIQGSSIACSVIPGKAYYQWLFYQKPDTTFVEYVMQDTSSWKIGVFKSQLVYDPGAYITSASYGKDSHRVFTVDRENKLCVTEFDPGSSWSQTKQLTTVIPSSAAAAVAVAGNVPWVRVYLQTTPSKITEWGTNDGKSYKKMKDPLPAQ